MSGGAARGEIPEWKLLSGLTQSESATPALPGPEAQPREGRGRMVSPTIQGRFTPSPRARRLSELAAILGFHSCASVGTAECCRGVGCWDPRG